MPISQDQLAVWKRWWAGKGGWLINNATLLTHSWIAVPALIAEVERLTQSLEAVCASEWITDAKAIARAALEGAE